MAKVKKTRGPKVYEAHDDTVDGTLYESADRLMAMMTLASLGVTSEEYDEFLKRTAELRSMFEEIAGGSVDTKFPFTGGGHIDSEEAEPLPEAENKTLRLRVQMKGVTKPPMWREIEVPADFTFAQLHYAIQAATGLRNQHLWQFQRRAYDPDLQIGIPQMDPFEFGLNEWTHNANETPITAFLAAKGDKLEYVYDFGDDWVFTITVLELVDRKGEVAVCPKWKSDLQPIENTGGVWSYIELRELIEQLPTMPLKKKKKEASQRGFDNADEFKEWLDENLIDIELVNEQLSEIPSEWEEDF